MMRIIIVGIIMFVMMFIFRSLLVRIVEEKKRGGWRGTREEKTTEKIVRCIEMLGLKPGASREEVNEAYRDLASVWHPDRFANNLRLQKKAEERLKEINAAYEYIRSFYCWK
jgi:preprotein translocase subunit Sec63